jgi:hypothetical protein
LWLFYKMVCFVVPPKKNRRVGHVGSAFLMLTDGRGRVCAAA